MPGLAYRFPRQGKRDEAYEARRKPMSLVVMSVAWIRMQFVSR